MEIHRFSGFPSSKFDDADLQRISSQCPLMGGFVHTEEGQVTAAMRRMPRDLKVATCRGTGRPQLCSGKPYRNETMSEKGCEDMCRTLSLFLSLSLHVPIMSYLCII